MADINVGAISEALNNKADRDFNNTDAQSRFDNKANANLSNVPSAYDYVVASQKPTSANGYTWYRKYKSGWVEQGGYDSTTFNTKTWSFPIEMKDSNYTLTLSVGYGNIDSQNGKFGLTERTTTGFTYKVVSLAGNATGENMSWSVSGQGA